MAARAAPQTRQVAEGLLDFSSCMNTLKVYTASNQIAAGAGWQGKMKRLAPLMAALLNPVS